jgi:PD-(D/E)XK nuclease superfamily
MNTNPVLQLPPVLPLNEALTLSSGALQAYANCPRQFFYQAVLKLPGTSFDQAEWGKLWHSVMEVFHQLPEPTPALLRELVSEVCQTIPRTPERWPQRSLTWLDALPALHQRDLYARLHRVADSLCDSGMLLTVTTHQSAQVEYTVTFNMPDCNARFRLRLDLAYPDNAQQWHIVDYKTYGSSKFSSQKADTLLQHLKHALQTFPRRELDAPHRQQFPLPSSKPFVAQLPLYSLAARQTGWPMAGFGLHILRPAEDGGCKPIDTPVTDDELDLFAEALTQWIQTQLRLTTHFMPVPEGDPCGQCAYTLVCPRAADDPQATEAVKN